MDLTAPQHIEGGVNMNFFYLLATSILLLLDYDANSKTKKRLNLYRIALAFTMLGYSLTFIK